MQRPKFCNERVASLAESLVGLADLQGAKKRQQADKQTEITVITVCVKTDGLPSCTK